MMSARLAPQAETAVSPEDRELLDQILIGLQPPSDYVGSVKNMTARNGLRSDLRALIGHLCPEDSPVHSDAELDDDRYFKRILRVAGGAVRQAPDLRQEVEALILGARSAQPAVAAPSARVREIQEGRETPVAGNRHEIGRKVTLKPGGGPLYPALSSETLSLPGTSRGGGEYLNALMPCPVDPDIATAESWLRGLAWHSDVMNIMLDDPDADLIDDILELETEIDRQMDDLLKRSGLRPAQDPDACTRERDWLLAMPGQADSQLEEITDKFEMIVFLLMQRHQPAEYSLIHGMSPGLTLGDTVPAMLAATRDCASRWLENEGFIEPDHPHNPMGTICGHDCLTQDTVLERAAFVHLYSGEPLARALFDSLLEFRMAQLDRHLDGAAPLLRIDHLKSIMLEDPGAQLDRYTDARSDPEPEM